MKKANIAFDLDGVILNFAQAVIEVLQAKHLKINAADITYTGFKEGVQLHQDLYDNAVDEALRRTRGVQVFEESMTFIKKLYEETKQAILIVTNRPKRYANNTYVLLDAIFGEIPYMLCFANGTTGRPPRKDDFLFNHTFFVEDKPTVANFLDNCGKKVFLQNNLYNKDVELNKTITRINTLADIPLETMILEE